MPVPALAVAGLFGLLLGSFLNVVAHRLPLGASLVKPRSALPGVRHAGPRRTTTCPSSRGSLLRGRCRDCGTPISRALPARRGRAPRRCGSPSLAVHYADTTQLVARPRARDLPRADRAHRPRAPAHPEQAHRPGGARRARARPRARPGAASPSGSWPPARRRRRLPASPALMRAAAWGWATPSSLGVLGLFLGAGRRSALLMSRSSPAPSVGVGDHRPRGHRRGPQDRRPVRRRSSPLGGVVGRARGRADPRLVPDARLDAGRRALKITDQHPTFRAPWHVPRRTSARSSGSTSSLEPSPRRQVALDGPLTVATVGHRAAAAERRPRRRGRRRRGARDACSRTCSRSTSSTAASASASPTSASSSARSSCRRSRSAQELEAAVRFLAQDELPMPLDEAVIDFHPLGIVDTAERPAPARRARRRPPPDDRGGRSPRSAPPACAPRASTSPPSPWSARSATATRRPRSSSPSAA